MSRDGVNADYVRLPGGEVITDARRDWARAIVEEARALERAQLGDGAVLRLRELENDWADQVDGRGTPGRALSKELLHLRGELTALRERLEQRVREEPPERPRDRER